MTPWKTPIREDDGIPPDFVRDANNVAPWQREVVAKKAAALFSPSGSTDEKFPWAEANQSFK